MKSRNILVSSIGSPAGNGVVRCLHNIPHLKIIGLDANPNCHGQDYVSHFYTVPKINDVNYLPEMHRIIGLEQVDLFIPTIQPDLATVEALSKVTKVLSSKPESIMISTNKKIMYQRMVDSGLSDYVPKYFSFSSNKELDYSRLTELGYPTTPVCFKPTTEHGGMSFKIINLGSIDQVAINLFHNKDSSWRTWDELKVLLSLCKPLEVLVSEYLAGEEYSVDVLIKDGKVIIAIPRKRTQVAGGIVTRGIVQKKDDLIEAVKRIVPVFDLEFFANVQFKYASDGTPKLIDINPRFCGSHIMSYGAGVNFPLLAVKLAFDEGVPDIAPRWGTEMVRYWESAFYEPS